VPIRSFDESYLTIHTPEVLALIEKDDPSWERMVPPKVAEIIKAERLFRGERERSVAAQDVPVSRAGDGR